MIQPSLTHIVVDSNVLVLFFVGLLDPKLIVSLKRTSEYTAEDYARLAKILARYQTIVLTPSVLGEVSNLCRQTDSAKLRRIFEHLSTLLQRVFPENLASPTGFREETVSMERVVRSGAFIPFGVADATIEQLCATGLPVLTDDGPLYLYLSTRYPDVYNFSHVRFREEGARGR